MAMQNVPRCLAFRLLCWGMVLLPFPCLTAGDSSSVPSGKPASTHPALEEWRVLKREVGEIVAMPAGPEQIDRCRAFLKKHPDFQDIYPLLNVLVADWLAVPENDRAYAVQLLERMAALSDRGYGLENLLLVDRFYLPYHLSPESALRLLAMSRKEIEEVRRLVPLESDAGIRSQMVPDWSEFHLLVDEGRVLLQAGDASGALAKLLEVERKRDDGGASIQLRDAQGKILKTFPGWDPLSNWMNLAMAQAYAALGKLDAAKERLARVGGEGGVLGAIQGPKEDLATQLKVVARTAGEIRGDPLVAPDFDLEDLDGKHVRLSDYKDKIVLVMIWATW
jgi:hypothetical protein